MPGIGYGSIRAGTTSHENPKRKWWNLMPFLVALVVIAEISFLGKLDMAKNAALVNSWWSDSFSHAEAQGTETETTRFDGGSVEEEGSCERWLEREDALIYSRDFHKHAVLVTGADQDWKHCSVGCKFGHGFPGKHDAAFGPQENGIAGILRSMESAQYYAENNIAHARGRGYTVVMTTSLSSDVPVGYFSWAEYDIMAPVQEKTESALAAAFISNCGARNFRLQALEALERSEIKIDSYGGCHRNRDGKVDKVEALKHYKFSLAFENSNEEDYVTEKFFQSLVAVLDCWNKRLNSESIEYVGLSVGLYFHTGRPRTIPVVVGAPNIEEFAPCPGCVLHIKEQADVSTVAKTMKYLAENPDAYNQSLRWKYEGPSDSFKALIDMAAVHSSCRLCIHLATQIREKEEKSHLAKKRPCKCSRGGQTVFHVYARERGRFEMESVFLRSSNLTLKGLEQAVLEKFKQLNHVPVWKQERPESIRGGNVLKIHKIYPLGLTQRQALYTFRFQGDADFRSHLQNNPCSNFEVIFV